MRKVLFGLTAVAIGALAVPTVGSAQMPERVSPGVSAGSVSGGGGGAALSAPAGGNVSTGGQVSGKANVRTSRNADVREGQISNQARTNIQSNIRSDRWAGNSGDWRLRRHHRNFGFVPFAAYGDFYGDDYAAYDTCWDYVWTPAGYERVYVCGAPGFYASAWPGFGFYDY
jgi:hypothetical protein